MMAKSKHVFIKFKNKSWWTNFSKKKPLWQYFPVEYYGALLNEKMFKFSQEWVVYKIFEGISHAHRLR